jgi:U3 small nucleolar RNA-associated protein 22
MIVQHILHHRFGLETEAMTTWQRGYDEVLRISPAAPKVLVDPRVPVGFKAAITRLMGLSGGSKGWMTRCRWRSFKQVQFLRCCNIPAFWVRYPIIIVAASLAQNVRYTPTMEMILQFERSSRWPDRRPQER